MRLPRSQEIPIIDHHRGMSSIGAHERMVPENDSTPGATADPTLGPWMRIGIRRHRSGNSSEGYFSHTKKFDVPPSIRWDKLGGLMYGANRSKSIVPFGRATHGDIVREICCRSWSSHG